MAWNQPNSMTQKNAPKSKRSTIRPVHIWYVVGAIIIVGGLIAWSLAPEKAPEPQPEPEPAKPARIKEVKTPIPTKVEEPEEPAKVDPNARPTKVGEVVNGYVMLPSGRIHKRQGVITNSVASRIKASYQIFEHNTDNEIACYLSIRPGDTLVGDRRYNGRFKEQFLESLKTPIEITEDDTPEQVALKQDVIQARADLKEALDKGEDIEQILIDTRKELQDLMRYKMELRSQFNKLKNECETEEDVDLLLKACNELLESKGIAPMQFGPLTRRKILSQGMEF